MAELKFEMSNIVSGFKTCNVPRSIIDGITKIRPQRFKIELVLNTSEVCFGRGNL